VAKSVLVWPSCALLELREGFAENFKEFHQKM